MSAGYPGIRGASSEPKPKDHHTEPRWGTSGQPAFLGFSMSVCRQNCQGMRTHGEGRGKQFPYLMRQAKAVRHQAIDSQETEQT